MLNFLFFGLLFGELELVIGDWNVVAARIGRGRPFVASDEFMSVLGRSIFAIPPVGALFLEDGLSLLKKYAEGVEILRLALLEFLSAESVE